MKLTEGEEEAEDDGLVKVRLWSMSSLNNKALHIRYARIKSYNSAERTKQMEQILNYQVPAEGLEPEAP
jgi:hypothetical protein